MIKRVQAPSLSLEDYNHLLVSELQETRFHLEQLLVPWEEDRIPTTASIGLRFKQAYDFMVKQTILGEG